MFNINVQELVTILPSWRASAQSSVGRDQSFLTAFSVSSGILDSHEHSVTQTTLASHLLTVKCKP